MCTCAAQPSYTYLAVSMCSNVRHHITHIQSCSRCGRWAWQIEIHTLLHYGHYQPVLTRRTVTFTVSDFFRAPLCLKLEMQNQLHVYYPREKIHQTWASLFCVHLGNSHQSTYTNTVGMGHIVYLLILLALTSEW